MNKEILLVVDVVSNEKGVEKEVIFEAIEATPPGVGGEPPPSLPLLPERADHHVEGPG